MNIKKSSEAEKEIIQAGIGSSRQVLIGPDVGPNFALRKFTIEPGGSIPLHTNTVEHEQYVLKGKGEIKLEGETYIVTKDDVVFMPAGSQHNYKNIGEEDFEFLCIVPNKEDIIEFIEKS